MSALFVISLVPLLLTACASLPSNPGNTVSTAYAQPGTTALGQVFSEASSSHTHQSGFQILDTGRRALQARLALIESAQHALDMQYYIWNSDVSGRYMAQRVLLAADRGVKVRLLLDDINIGGRDPILVALDSHPNIEVRIFNPTDTREGSAKLLDFFGNFNRLNRRMHNKTFVADASVGIIGGRNIGDEYFDLHPAMNFRDRDMLAVGPIVEPISANFDAYWNSAWTWSVTNLKGARLAPDAVASALAQARSSATDGSLLRIPPPQDAQAGLAVMQDAIQQLEWADAELIYDPPIPIDVNDSDTPKRSAQALAAVIKDAQREVLIESAYFILGETQLENVKSLHTRGVNMRALTNSLATNDLTANHAGYARTRRGMLVNGLDLYELRPDAQACQQLIDDVSRCSSTAIFALHSKSIVVDREVLYVGSFNINLRSALFNSETVLIVHSPILAEQVAEAIDMAMQPVNSWHVSLDAEGRMRWDTKADSAVLYHEPETGWWRRFKVGFIKWLPLEKYY